MTDSVERKGLLLKADPIAATFREEVRLGLEQCSRRPKLVGILSTTLAPSKNYAEFTQKQCEDLDVEFVLKRTGAAASPNLSEGEGVEEAIIEANQDDSVNGIMVLLCFNLPVLLTHKHRSTFQYLDHNRFVDSVMSTRIRCIERWTFLSLGSLSTAGLQYP